MQNLYDNSPRLYPDDSTSSLIPDCTISADDRNNFGYTYDKMLPLSLTKAAELFESDHTIYLLYSDNTESMALDSNDIINHTGMCGIESSDWERSPILAMQIAKSKDKNSYSQVGNTIKKTTTKEKTKTTLNERLQDGKIKASAQKTKERGGLTAYGDKTTSI